MNCCDMAPLILTVTVLVMTLMHQTKDFMAVCVTLMQLPKRVLVHLNFVMLVMAM